MRITEIPQRFTGDSLGHSVTPFKIHSFPVSHSIHTIHVQAVRPRSNTPAVRASHTVGKHVLTTLPLRRDGVAHAGKTGLTSAAPYGVRIGCARPWPGAW